MQVRWISTGDYSEATGGGFLYVEAPDGSSQGDLARKEKRAADSFIKKLGDSERDDQGYEKKRLESIEDFKKDRKKVEKLGDWLRLGK